MNSHTILLEKTIANYHHSLQELKRSSASLQQQLLMHDAYNRALVQQLYLLNQQVHEQACQQNDLFLAVESKIADIEILKQKMASKDQQIEGLSSEKSKLQQTVVQLKDQLLKARQDKKLQEIQSHKLKELQQFKTQQTRLYNQKNLQLRKELQDVSHLLCDTKVALDQVLLIKQALLSERSQLVACLETSLKDQDLCRELLQEKELKIIQLQEARREQCALMAGRLQKCEGVCLAQQQQLQKLIQCCSSQKLQIRREQSSQTQLQEQLQVRQRELSSLKEQLLRLFSVSHL